MNMLEPGQATVTDVIAVIYGDEGIGGIDADSSPAKAERHCREVVRLATPFDAIQLALLESQLLNDSWRRFRWRSLKVMVRGIIKQVQDYQKAARAADRREKKKKAPRG